MLQRGWWEVLLFALQRPVPGFHSELFSQDSQPNGEVTPPFLSKWGSRYQLPLLFGTYLLLISSETANFLKKSRSLTVTTSIIQAAASLKSVEIALVVSAKTSYASILGHSINIMTMIVVDYLDMTYVMSTNL